ncbi:hypothetical protein [Halorubrum distributum]|uniref:Uncharacterized protein n=1 Tax=Halorubrum distributum JCM 13916 TaxID=1230455 RepID=M0PBQ2_9EURY|nr:hypothetical protein [Halorubrum arcis]EMA67283.1 hypothetical protein C462_15819 [Halorubrum arcis JCM 13916]
MASRQGGSGDAEPLGPGSTERRTASTTAAASREDDVRRRSPPESPARRRQRAGRSDRLDRRTEYRSVDPPHGGEAATRTPEDPPVRDPSLYALTDHFRERLEQPGRYVSTRTVSDAIREGQLRWNSTDGWRFALVEGGVRFVVVVSDTETNSPVVVTGWTEVADREAALEASRWDGVDVDTIAVRAALSESASTPIPDRIRPRTVTRPFEVGEHRLETEPGEPFVRCTDCGCRFRSKEGITSRRCRQRSPGR